MLPFACPPYDRGLSKIEKITVHDLISATATHCNTHALPNTATRCQKKKKAVPDTNEALFEEWNCNALQHAAAHCNTQQRVAARCKLQHAATLQIMPHCIATHCNTL